MIGIKGMLKGFALVLMFGLSCSAWSNNTTYYASHNNCYPKGLCRDGAEQWDRFTLPKGLKGLMLNRLFIGHDIYGKYREAVYLILDGSTSGMSVAYDCKTSQFAMLEIINKETSQHIITVSERIPVVFNNGGEIREKTFEKMLEVLHPTICQNIHTYPRYRTDFR